MPARWTQNLLLKKMKNKAPTSKIDLAPTLTGHWYKVGKGYYPSVTQILTSFPQSPFLTKWVADHGWEESQAIKTEAGEKGTQVHNAVERLLKGAELDQQNYSLPEWWKLNTFWSWYKEYKPEVVQTELMVFSRKYKYAGTIDCVYKTKDGLTLIDFKTSGSIYDHFPLQVAGYAQAYEEMFDQHIYQTAILQLGAKNKNGYRFVIQDNWKENVKPFLAVKKIFDYQYGKGYVPQIMNLPNMIKL